MKKLYLLLIFIFSFSSFLQAQTENEKDAIKALITKAYVEGLHNGVSVDDFENGFHPGFNLLIKKGALLEELAIYNWTSIARERQKKNPKPKLDAERTTCKFIQIDVTGEAAMAKIELWKKDKLIFTDYLSLYKFPEGWKVVSKIYQDHRKK